MSKDRLSKEYKEGVDRFLDHAVEVADDPNHINCPCIICGNLNKLNRAKIKNHLYQNGVDETIKSGYGMGRNYILVGHLRKENKEMKRHLMMTKIT